MNDSMNDPGEAERQWWSIEFEYEFDPDTGAIWVTSNGSRDCPDCQRILQRGASHDANPKKKTKRGNIKSLYDYVRADLRQRRK